MNRRKAGEAEASARVAKDYATQTAYLKLARELRDSPSSQSSKVW